MKTDVLSKKQACAPRPPQKSGRAISLPIIDAQTGMKHSRAGMWRFYVLAGVHVVMIAHVIHWLWAGRTLTPIEPSESMETIREGQINMGFIFFGLAILSTLILGRWVCGWGCHLVAYQDLTLWVLKKLHLRPKAFRTRFLFIVTTLIFAAGWMFFVPLGARIWNTINGHPAPEFTMHLTRTGYWDTFPGPVFAVLTLLIAGMATIYFLGPKGFCTYACPYGAIFAISDKFAPSRIRVNDNCNQCGHCTAVCTSNVDVAQEVNLYKMVVDPGCMKCLDCIEVCPTNALSVGWGMPSLGAKPAAAPRPRKYDLTLVEEIAALGLFFVVLVTVNGLYGQFPFLLSLAIAGIVTYVLLKSARLIYGPDVLVQKMRLKVNCRVTPAGAAWLAGSLLLAGMLVHSAIWRYHDLLGNRAFAAGPPQPLDWQYNPSFHKTATPEQMEQIRSAAGHYEAMRRIGLVSLPEHRLHLAWAYLHTGKPDDAGKEIAAATRERPGLANLWLWRAKIMTYLDRPGDARDAFSKAMDLEQEEYGSASAADMKEPRPLSAEIWAEWGRFLLREGDPAGAGDALEKSVSFDPAYQIGRRALVDYYLAANRVGDARRTALQGLEHGFRSSKLSEVFDRIRIAENNPAAAIDDYTQALTRHPDDVLLLSNLAAALAEANRPADAAALCRRALKKAPDSAGLHATLGAVLVMTNDLAGAIREYQTVLRLLPSSADAAFRLAFLYAQTGRPAEAVPLLEKVRQTGAPDERKTAQQLLNELQGSQPSPRE